MRQAGHRRWAFSRLRLIDLVVLDYYMPGVDGCQVAEVFKARRPELPILMISGRPVEEGEVLQYVDAFLVKGKSAGLLVPKIEELLRATSETRTPEAINVSTDGERQPELWEKLIRQVNEGDPDALTALISETNRLVEEQDRKQKETGAQLADRKFNR